MAMMSNGEKAVGNGISPTRRTTEEILSSISHLTKLREWLCNLNCERLVSNAASKHPPSFSKDGANLSQSIEDTRAKYISRRASLNLQSEVLQSMKSSDEVFKAFHPTITELSTDDPEHHKTQQQAIREKICRMNMISKKICQLTEEKRALKLRSLELDEEYDAYGQVPKLYDINKHVPLNRIQDRVSVNRCDVLALDDHVIDRSSKDYEKKEKELANIRRIKHVYQYLILASGLEIHDDPELRSLVMELEKPESMMLTGLDE